MKVLIIGLVLLLSAGALRAQKMSAADSATLAALPPLPVIDTTAAPEDALTTEIRKMLMRTVSMSAEMQDIKRTMNMEREANPQLPKEFFDRVNQQLENGRMARLLENIMIRMYRKDFNLAEMREINKFYDTPVGKKLAAHEGEYVKLAETEGARVGQFIALEIGRQMIKEGKWK